MIFLCLLTIFLAFSPPSVLGCKDQCCDLNCWEQCFTEVDDVNAAFYQQIYQIVQTIRNLYAPCSKPHGTCYLLDSSVFNTPLFSGSELMDFERNLASIIALTQPVSNECNPFFVNKYFRNWAYYPWSWQCQDKCNAARTLASRGMQFTQNNAQPSWIGGGCILCNHAFNNRGLRCSAKTDNELLIAFANNPSYTTPDGGNCKKYNRVVIGTSAATTWSSLIGWASPGLAFQLRAHRTNLQATKNLLSCMNKRCCPDHRPYSFPNPLRSTESESRETFSYNTGADKQIKTFQGTLEDFKKLVDSIDNEDPCAPNPCKNGGTCVKTDETKTGYSCRCTRYCYGSTCERCKVLPGTGGVRPVRSLDENNEESVIETGYDIET